MTIDDKKGESRYGQAKQYFKNDIAFDTYCNLRNRMVEIVREAMDETKPMTDFYRVAYVLMAIELYGLDVIDEEFLYYFLLCVCPQYWLYVKHGTPKEKGVEIKVQFQYANPFRPCAAVRTV